MADLVNTCVRTGVDEIITRLPISSENPADLASPPAISSSVSEAAETDDERSKKVDQFHGELLETPWKFISCGNKSTENATIEQEDGRYQSCDKVITLQGDKNDAYYIKSYGRCGCGMHEHLLFDILLWLPVISLLRFKSVCKFWCSLIDSPTFIAQHCYHNRSKDSLLGHHTLTSYPERYDSKFCLLSGEKYEVYSTLDYKYHWCSANDISILNSCNGIVCLLNKVTKNAALWNPATNQLRPLPESLLSDHVNYGFGFDVKSNDYKVVKIHYPYENEDNCTVEVYSLRTDSWKTIHKDVIFPFEFNMEFEITTCKNGICLWTGYAQDKFSPILISFNWNDEIFETAPLPGERDPDHDVSAYHALDVLNDKLYYIKGVDLGPFSYYHTYYEIWRLDEYGAKKSWTKICKFGPTGDDLKYGCYVVGVLKNEEILLSPRRYREGDLRVSDLDARGQEEYRELQNPNPDLSQFVRYNESLVSLKRADFAYKGTSAR